MPKPNRKTIYQNHHTTEPKNTRKTALKIHLNPSDLGLSRFFAAMPVTGMDYGFTGHEHLDVFMLVNMNGRMYDPVIGRFLSPDPVLQFPSYTQGLNPYAYALNNPLRFVDPDGYSLVGQLIALTFSMVLAPINPMLAATVYSVIMTIDYAIENGRNVNAGELFGYFMQTFVMSTASMGATKGIGGYFDQFEKTGLRELKRAVAHGVFNGAMRYAQGGKFEHGFMSGFVSSLGGSFMQANAGNMSKGAQVAMSAVIGGTAEKLGGGKFANGAVTGAYVMMFNHLANKQQKGRNVPTKEWMEAKAKELIEWEKARERKIRNGESTYSDRFDLHFEGYSNQKGHRDSHGDYVSVQIEGQSIEIYFEFHPAVSFIHNQVTSIRESGKASFYGMKRGLKGMYHIQIWSVTSSQNHMHIGSLYLNEMNYRKVWNYIYSD